MEFFNVLRWKYKVVYLLWLYCFFMILSGQVRAQNILDDEVYFRSPPLEINAEVGFYRIEHDITIRTSKQIPAVFLRTLNKMLLYSGVFKPVNQNAKFHLRLQDSLFYGLEARFTDEFNNPIFSGYLEISDNLAEQELSIIQFVDEAVQAIDNRASLFQSAILYVESQPNSSTKIRLTNFLGRKQITLVDNDLVNLFPTWSPDATKFLFTTLSLQGSQIFIYDFLDKSLTQVQIPGSNSGGAWFADGQKIVLTNSYRGFTNLYLYDLQSKQQQKLTNSLFISTSGRVFGEKLLFTSDRSRGVQIFIRDRYNVLNDNWRMTFRGSYNSEPSWSNSGQMFVYTAGLGGIFQLFIMNEQGTKSKQLTFDQKDSMQAVFSSDDRQLLYTEGSAEGRTLKIRLLDGSMVRRLFEKRHPNNLYQPSWTSAFDWKKFP